MELFYPADAERLPLDIVSESQIVFNQNTNDWGDEAIEVFEYMPEHIQIVSELEFIESEMRFIEI